MIKCNPKCNFIIALSIAAIFGIVGSSFTTVQAAPAKKLTYDGAWTRCMVYVNRGVAKNSDSQRYQSASACMQRYGYRL